MHAIHLLTPSPRWPQVNGHGCVLGATGHAETTSTRAMIHSSLDCLVVHEHLRLRGGAVLCISESFPKGCFGLPKRVRLLTSRKNTILKVRLPYEIHSFDHASAYFMRSFKLQANILTFQFQVSKSCRINVKQIFE